MYLHIRSGQRKPVASAASAFSWLNTHSLLQAALVDFSAVESIAQAGTTTIERLCAIFKQYPDRTCFGQPAKATPEWRLVTYKDVWERIQVSCHILA